MRIVLAMSETCGIDFGRAMVHSPAESSVGGAEAAEIVGGQQSEAEDQRRRRASGAPPTAAGVATVLAVCPLDSGTKERHVRPTTRPRGGCPCVRRRW